MEITLSKSSKSVSQNNDNSFSYNNRDLSRNKYFNNHKQNKNLLCLSPRQNNQGNKSPLSYNIISMSSIQKNINIEEELEQYKLHPFRRINLKALGEGIRKKLCEMEEEKLFQNDKNLSSREDYFSKQVSKTKMQEKYNIETKNIDIKDNSKLNKSSVNDESINKKIIKSIILDKKPNYEFFQKHSDILLNIEKNNSCKESFNIPKKNEEIKQASDYKNNMDNQEVQNKDLGNISKKDIKNGNLSSILESKYRNIKKLKNLYDSMDDNESEDDCNKGNVLNPEEKFILFFDLFIIIFYLYTFFFYTLDLAKTKCFCSIKNKTTFNDIIFYINDLLYILDLIISFFRGFYNFEFKLIQNNALVVKNYLTGDFYLDLLEAIPIFSISKYICLYKINETICYIYKMPSFFIALKMASILKSLKIIKILGAKKNQALDNFFELISENYACERATELIINSLVFSGIIHCFVCFHIFIGKHSYSNWLVLTNSENESIISIYIESLYFLVTTLTTVGYGDITCKSFEERVFQIILLAVGSIFYSYIISTIGNLIKVDSNAKIKYNNDLNILESIRVSYPNMPYKLYQNINKYLESKSNSQKKYDVNSLIDTLPIKLKNSILFTMYKSAIKNFKFFKKNDNSKFIADILGNFIPVVSKKNEILIYEGEIVEEIIFIKDGRISMNAAIYLEDPSKSINKYFNEKFKAFTLDEEKKLCESHSNDVNFRSGFVSTMNGSISYDTAKNKINNAFKTLKAEQNSDDKSLFQLNKQEDKTNTNTNTNTYTNSKTNDLIKFDINGGVIKNEDGTHQYLKILDIRKNEHFGCVFMTLKEPCPLTLEVKSKFAELYLLKKEEAVTISKSYPNIWKKLYEKEFHNLRSIKNLTFTALRKYIEINELLFNLNLDDIIKANDITVNDLNVLEKSIIAEKSIALYQASKINLNNKKLPSKNGLVMRFKTMNSDNIDKKRNRPSLGKISAYRDNKLFRKKIKDKHSNSIICNSVSKEKFLKLVESLGVSSSKRTKPKLVCFASDVKVSKSSKNDSSQKESPLIMRKLSSSEIQTNLEDEDDKSSIKNDKRLKKIKLKKLKNLLINFQKKLKIIKYNISEYPYKKAITKRNSIESSFSKNGINRHRRSYKINIIKENQKIPLLNSKTINSRTDNYNNRTEKYKNSSQSNINSIGVSNLEDSLIKDLKSFCEEETDFSFCSLKEEKSFNMNELSQSKNIEVKILSSYENLNEITKGNYIEDIVLQNEIKLNLKNYYMIKSEDDSLSLKSNDFSSTLDDKTIQKFQSIHKIKKFQNKPKLNTNIEILPKGRKKKSHKTMSKKLRIGKEKKKKNSIKNKPTYETDIKNKNGQTTSLVDNKSSLKKNIKNNDFSLVSSKKNTFLFPTFKNTDQSNEQNNINIQGSDNKSLSFNQNIINRHKVKKDSLNISIKNNKQIYGLNEVEFELNKSPINKNLNNNTINIDNENKNNETNNTSNNCNNIFKEKNHSKKSRHKRGKWKNSTNIINQIFPYNYSNNIITNNITTISSNNNDNKEIFNTNSKINNVETSLSIKFQVKNNLNKESNEINNTEKSLENDFKKYFCHIY